MTQVTADMVRELREMTGAPMMDTKRALVDADGDLEAAKQLLRERGMASAGKRAGNETPEGVVLTRLDDAKGEHGRLDGGMHTDPVHPGVHLHVHGGPPPQRLGGLRDGGQSALRLDGRGEGNGDVPAAGIDHLVDTLDDDRRAAFVLTQVLGCSYAEAAEVCDTAIGTIRSRVARARADLLDQLRAADTA